MIETLCKLYLLGFISFFFYSTWKTSKSAFTVLVLSILGLVASTFMFIRGL